MTALVAFARDFLDAFAVVVAVLFVVVGLTAPLWVGWLRRLGR